MGIIISSSVLLIKGKIRLKTFKTINPTHLVDIEEYHYETLEKIPTVLEQSQTAFLKWKTNTLSVRCEVLKFFSQQLLINKEVIADKITQEMGKPITQALAEMDKSIGLIEYCVQAAQIHLFPDSQNDFTIYREPLGIIYGIMPWNFPVWQTLRFAVPTLLAGNAVILKPADCVAGTALLLQKCFDNACSVKNVYSTVFVDHETSDSIISSHFVRGVSMTGSSRAGRTVAKKAGEFLKKCVLELGGNDAYVVCEDADIEWAVEKVFMARILNTGQSCISAKRIFVHKNIEKIFINSLLDKIKSVPCLEPSEGQSMFGPLARMDLRETLKKQVLNLIKEGARSLFVQDLNGKDNVGSYYPITILHDFPKNSSLHKEELFGPIFCIVSYSTDEEVMTWINSSPYGLGGAIFSQNVERALTLSLQMETGSVAINDMFRSTYDRPFGGIKDSGFGRELGKEGFHEFTNTKVIVHRA